MNKLGKLEKKQIKCNFGCRYIEQFLLTVQYINKEGFHREEKMLFSVNLDKQDALDLSESFFKKALELKYKNKYKLIKIVYC